MAAQAYFAADYAEARGKFLQACDHAGVAVESVDRPLPGPHGETLAIDHAWIGAPDAQRVLVTLSGTHGVEGFAGSGAQVAWLRRVNEDNVDLNRNFVDHGRPYPRNSGFDQLVEALCPAAGDTPMLKEFMGGEDTAEGRGRFAASLPMGRLIHPENVGWAAVHPAWDEASMVTGACLPVDGGRCI